MIKHVLLLDDNQIQNKLLKDGHLKQHPVSDVAKFDVIDTTEHIVPVIQTIRFDLIVLDYYLSGITANSIASSIKYRQPNCAIWLYSGYNPDYLEEAEKRLFHRCIEKGADTNLPYLLDQVFEFINAQRYVISVH